MTSYQYWRGNILIGEDNSISREELKETTVCPYCKRETDVLFKRTVEIWEQDKYGRDLFYTDAAGRFHRCTHIETYPIGCPECMQEYERGEKGYYPAYGLDVEPDVEWENRHNCKGTDYEY